MRTARAGGWLLIAALLLYRSPAVAEQRDKDGFTPIFDGVSLNGWKSVGGEGTGYFVRDGLIICPAGFGGNLFTEQEYSDFILRFEFKLDKGANNGIGIRAPYEGDAAYMGMEIQILDDDDPMYATLHPWQYHSSVYGVVAAKRGALKQAGQWNQEEISAIGRHIKITVNGKVTVNADLNAVHDPAILLAHPGMRRDRGHIGLLGHEPTEVQFRNLRIKDLARPEKENTPPPGFKALFNGKDLTGWKGLVSPDGGPPARARMSPAELAAAQVKADQEMRDHWMVKDGVLIHDGKGNSLCTAHDYGDFEMLVDWKITSGGDSGIYLRGSPQVQIWDPQNHPGRPGEGSGGLYNNQKNPSSPTQLADNPIGEWNRLRILMVGDKVTVYLNNILVVNNITMENYWERDKPIYPIGQIELQHHGSTLYFKNIYIRELPR